MVLSPQRSTPVPGAPRHGLERRTGLCYIITKTSPAFNEKAGLVFRLFLQIQHHLRQRPAKVFPGPARLLQGVGMAADLRQQDTGG